MLKVYVTPLTSVSVAPSRPYSEYPSSILYPCALPKPKKGWSGVFFTTARRAAVASKPVLFNQMSLRLACDVVRERCDIPGVPEPAPEVRTGEEVGVLHPSAAKRVGEAIGLVVQRGQRLLSSTRLT